MLKLLDRKNDFSLKISKRTPQEKIENELTKIINLGNIECAYVFSEEGLLMAGIQGGSDFTNNQAAELIYSVYEALKLLEESDNFNGSQELLFVSQTRKKISVRPFQAFGQRLTLILVVPRSKTYRSHTNRLIRNIQKIGQREIE